MFNIVLILFVGALFSAGAVPLEPNYPMSSMAERLQDVGVAPAYWTATCGDRSVVGSYTLMMDWEECKDYCQYFPHAGELGHTYQFADIVDNDDMECLRYNMEEQYQPGNGYAGHYWVGGYRGEDGQYHWTTGNPMTYTDFVGNPGAEPYIHQTIHPRVYSELIINKMYVLGTMAASVRVYQIPKLIMSELQNVMRVGLT